MFLPSLLFVRFLAHKSFLCCCRRLVLICFWCCLVMRWSASCSDPLSLCVCAVFPAFAVAGQSAAAQPSPRVQGWDSARGALQLCVYRTSAPARREATLPLQGHLRIHNYKRTLRPIVTKAQAQEQDIRKLPAPAHSTASQHNNCTHTQPHTHALTNTVLLSILTLLLVVFPTAHDQQFDSRLFTDDSIRFSDVLALHVVRCSLLCPFSVRTRF